MLFNKKIKFSTIFSDLCYSNSPINYFGIKLFNNNREYSIFTFNISPSSSINQVQLNSISQKINQNNVNLIIRGD